MKTIIYSVMLLLLAPCNKKSAKSTSTETRPVNDNSKVEIFLERTPCFGKCPTYIMTISGATKTASFKGERNTEKIGTYTKQLTDEELKELVAAFDAAGFFSLNDNYIGEITDFPTTYVGFTNNGKTKKIADRGEAPPVLRNLQKILTDFAETTEGWKKSETADH